MDMTRGSRRARHVANNVTPSNANAASSPSVHQAAPGRGGGGGAGAAASSPAGTPSGSSRLVPGQGASPAAALVTPEAPPPHLHRTPDQPADQRRRRAPPPNPFRLHTSECLFVDFSKPEFLLVLVYFSAKLVYPASAVVAYARLALPIVRSASRCENALRMRVVR
ncbi:anaphase-promoting complex subunit 10 [Fusarium albosuccineum]|uniref:Anaphase-promoting complex subunit 10 n=1 Tax=Fusarium albosuccineum TaxID=1237068 RepID=A0A8H4LNW9_9HYPO|nr:anaphase-promoting complex subunit 10 [Fusarium albosuccineum]